MKSCPYGCLIEIALAAACSLPLILPLLTSKKSLAPCSLYDPVRQLKTSVRPSLYFLTFPASLNIMCPKPYATSVALFQYVEELKTGDSTHMWSHRCQRERDNPFCWPAWLHSDNTQDTVHLLHPHGTPLTHVQLGHLNVAQQHCLLASQQSACIAVHGLDTDFFSFFRFSLLNFTRFLSAHFCNLLRSL